MNFTTPLEMTGDTLGCQIKKLGTAELKLNTVGSQERWNMRSIQRGRGRWRVNQRRQILWCRDGRDGKRGLYGETTMEQMIFNFSEKKER